MPIVENFVDFRKKSARFPGFVEVDIPGGFDVEVVFEGNDGFGEEAAVEVARAPAAVAVGVDDGLELVFARDELGEADALGGVDDALVEHMVLVVEELDDDLGGIGG